MKKKKKSLALALALSSSSCSSSSCIESPPKSKSKSRSSKYRGVTRHRWTGRYEAHLWDNTTWNALHNKRGRQIYLGAYDKEDDAARAYDLAALKYWGPNIILNFSIEMYAKDIEEMECMTKEEYLAVLRRRSSGFSRGVSKYRGVARHHHNGRWEARIGRVCGNKYLYLGTFGTQEEAAVAYDMASIEYRGPNAVTNFDIGNYAHMLKKAPPHDPVQVKREPSPNMPLPPPEELPRPKLEPATAVVMDEHEHEHPWDLCLDVGFNNFLIPDVPMERAVSDVFDYKGFSDDDIECMFDVPPLLGDTGVPHEFSGSPGMTVPEAALPSPTTSSSSSSTATSAPRNMQ